MLSTQQAFSILLLSLTPSQTFRLDVLTSAKIIRTIPTETYPQDCPDLDSQSVRLFCQPVLGSVKLIIKTNQPF